ncbi:hypothetical protein [Kordiimonas aestuarii]|uniref:hypothetical protein n=1 Tax=Kordiimonas aestuarii TaxID=1005925 RepID=UPI0021CE8B5E|nr:hypothetical protein [Kordiimonas aestuarii]
MDFFEVPISFFYMVDRSIGAVLPAAMRLALWALIASIVTMELYRLLSPQARIAELKLRFAQKKLALDSFDGEFEDAWPMMRDMLGAAFLRVGIVLPSTLVAALPFLFLVVCIDGAYADVDVLGLGPSWVRGWEPAFMGAMIVFSLLYKHFRRIQ